MILILKFDLWAQLFPPGVAFQYFNLRSASFSGSSKLRYRPFRIKDLSAFRAFPGKGRIADGKSLNKMAQLAAQYLIFE
ncbi:hypothetical protein D1823_14235 [Ruegeria sp. AD91A]|nr:hypothetical protein D1823_14235 [Ruegeria sp. AD91A]